MGILAIPITKAKKNMPVNTDELPEEIYAAALAEGLKVLLNKNMSKITGMKDMDAEELEKAQVAAWNKAEENLKNLLEGNLKKRKATKESREVTTEAMRLAREAIKAAYREAGKKISGIKASVITAAAKDLIAEDESFILKARENVAKMKQRDVIAIKPKEGSTLAALIAEAETAKPKVAPPRKKKDGTEGAVVASKAKAGKGKAAEAHAAH